VLLALVSVVGSLGLRRSCCCSRSSLSSRSTIASMGTPP
jgi:hypothetical protein